MTEETWKKTEERRDIKLKLLICKTWSKTEELQREYNNKARELNAVHVQIKENGRAI
jgi:hypothetical protein